VTTTLEVKLLTTSINFSVVLSVYTAFEIIGVAKVILLRAVSGICILSDINFCIIRAPNLLKEKRKDDDNNKINHGVISELKYNNNVILKFYFVHLTKSSTIHDGHIIQ